MSKHTPGPWNTGDSDIPVSCISVHGDRNGKHSTLARLASADFIGMPVDEALANARLIASAPDLLAALIHCAEDHEMLLRRLDGSFHLSSEAAIALLRNSTEQARHAITNATSS